MNLIKVKNVVFDFDKVVRFQSSHYDKDFIDVYFIDEFQENVLEISLSDFCSLLKFYNIDIKELK